MFTIPMPIGFKVRDTLPVTINGEATTLLYRDATHLVIGGADVRAIETISPTNMGGNEPLQLLMCADASRGEPSEGKEPT